jgi:hypothetical protein
MRPDDVDTLKCWLHFLEALLRFIGPLVVAIAHRIETNRNPRHVRRKHVQKDFDHA